MPWSYLWIYNFYRDHISHVMQMHHNQFHPQLHRLGGSKFELSSVDVRAGINRRQRGDASRASVPLTSSWGQRLRAHARNVQTQIHDRSFVSIRNIREPKSSPSAIRKSFSFHFRLSRRSINSSLEQFGKRCKFIHVSDQTRETWKHHI